MPIVHIDILKRPTTKKRALIEAVTRAVSETLDVAPEGIWVVVNELEKDQLAIGGQLMQDRVKPPLKTKAAARRKIFVPNKQTSERG